MVGTIENAVGIVLLWLVTQDDNRFACDVDFAVNVLVSFGSCNSITDKSNRQVKYPRASYGERCKVLLECKLHRGRCGAIAD